MDLVKNSKHSDEPRVNDAAQVIARPNDRHENPNRVKDLSIIVPAYNAMPYICQLIKSIEIQTVDLNKIEVLILDDGSTDETMSYLESLEHNWLKLIYLEHSGSPAGPRNKGIELACGEYIFFSDADDYFDSPFALEKMIHHAREDRLDIGKFKTTTDVKNRNYDGLFNQPQKHCTLSNSKIINQLGPYSLFRSEFLKSHNLRFPINCAYEDLPFTMESYFLANEIGIYCDENYYHRAKRPNSLTQKKSDNAMKFWTSDRAVNGVCNFFQTIVKHTTPEQNPRLFVRCFKSLRSSITRMNPDQWDVVREATERFYIDDIRILLTFSELVTLDAFFRGNEATKEIAEELNEIGHIPIVEFSENGSYRAGTYSFRLPEGLNDSAGKKKLDDPGITRNYISEATFDTDYIHLKGSCQLIRKTGKPKALRSIVRLTHANDCLLFPAEISNFAAHHAYGDVYVYNFDWNCVIDQISIQAGTAKDNKAYLLHSDFYAGSQRFTSKIGHLSSRKAKESWSKSSAIFPNGEEIKTVVTESGNFEFRRKIIK
jgi:glycosyltransferase involved in cell wall biosynthesis